MELYYIIGFKINGRMRFSRYSETERPEAEKAHGDNLVFVMTDEQFFSGLRSLL